LFGILLRKEGGLAVAGLEREEEGIASHGKEGGVVAK
jgi:hypothetical protein